MECCSQQRIEEGFSGEKRTKKMKESVEDQMAMALRKKRNDMNDIGSSSKIMYTISTYLLFKHERSMRGRVDVNITCSSYPEASHLVFSH